MYITENEIIKSFRYLSAENNHANSFLGLILLLCNREADEINYITSDMKQFAINADLAFNFQSTLPTRSFEKKWYSIFSQDWVTQTKKDLLDNKKISAYRVAIALYWNDSYLDNKDIVKRFKAKFRDNNVFEELFLTNEEEPIALSTAIPSRVSIYGKLGGDASTNKFTLSVNKLDFLSKPAGDLGAAPFSQTLYSGTSLRKIFSVFDFDFLKHFHINYKCKTKPNTPQDHLSLSKPFILLAGISGTGKSRFVREQAAMTDSTLNNFCLTPVRPDWHEPSDLLGYISRLGQNGAEFISTDVLNFLIKAWKAINPSHSELESGEFSNKDVVPFWLCLDEMNLAPVEQYFADYLAILETRKWDNDIYTCDALLKSGVITLLPETNQSKLRADWDLQEPEFDGLWAYFLNYGIPIPFNLIVAGTVNMDETTHGFSRKVIDRALTFDFGQFYPNEFSNFFTATKQAKALGYPLYTQAKLEDFSNIVCDNDAQKTITFIQGLNRILKNTLFELAYRALNELLLSVISFQPTTEQELLAVWDDFLMCKVLPRIEGDEDKLTSDGKPLLTELSGLLNQAGLLKPIWDSKRPDLLREDIGSLSKPILIECRSRKKIEWMQLRLTLNGFTSFWP